MIKHVEEYGRFLGISGFRNIQVLDAKTLADSIHKSVPAGVEVQLFDAALVATWEHLYFAAVNALMAFRGGCNASKSLAVESVLFASAQRQIRRAIDLVGVKAGFGDVAVLVFGESNGDVEAALSATEKAIGTKPDESILELTPQKIAGVKAAFDMSDAELQATSAKTAEAALVDAVVEHMALLSTHV